MFTPYPSRLILEQLISIEILAQRAEILKKAETPAYLHLGRRMLSALNVELKAVKSPIRAIPGDKLFGAVIVIDHYDEWRLEVLSLTAAIAAQRRVS